jgi:hypothetical protein
VCRNIKTLANFEPPATPDEIRASALQFVRKLSGTTRPSRANEAAFNVAVDEVEAAARRLIQALRTTAPPRTREEEARKARVRGQRRTAREARLAPTASLLAEPGHRPLEELAAPDVERLRLHGE